MRIFILLIALAITHSFTNVSAQIAQETPFEKADRILTNSPIIFEGIVVEQTFFEKPARNCWTANRIKITRIFKGFDNMDCGEIILVSRGSSGQWVDFGQGLYTQDGGSHSIQYRTGTKGIFFCKKNGGTHPDPPTNPTNNPFVKSSSEQGGNHLDYNYDPRAVNTVSLSTINHYADLFAGVTFSSFEEIGQFLKTNYDIDTNNFVYCPQSPQRIERLEAPENPVLVNPKDYPIIREAPVEEPESEVPDREYPDSSDKGAIESPKKREIDPMSKAEVKKKFLTTS